jgi:hypothetical protein
VLGSWIAASGLLLLGWSLEPEFPMQGSRPDDPQYVVRLIAQVITVRLVTFKPVKALPLLLVAAGCLPLTMAGACCALSRSLASKA